jgi:23S rRNA pseudouridine2605 synthase
MASVRLQKVLAHAGVSSRRAAEELMAAGRVRVDGRIVTELGTKVDPRGTRIEVDGQRVVRQASVYLILHKPRGVVSTMSDPEGRSTVHDLLGDVSAARVYPVGRLDFNTSGALLVTNDGDFSVALMHPRLAVPKTYVVKVQGLMQDADVDRWRRGVELTDGKTLPAKVKLLRHEVDKTWLELTITEGRNQQVRRMGDAIGFRVMRLARISFAGVSTESLPPGRWRYLTADELATLKKDYGVPKRIVSPPRPEGAVPSAGARPRPGPAPKGSHARPAEPGSRGASSRSGPSRSKPTGWDPSRESSRSRPSKESARSRPSKESHRSGASRSSGSRESAWSRSSKDSPRSGASRSSGPSRESPRSRSPKESPRAGASRTAHESRESGARYGGGAPGRRGPEVREDWGGGVRRGSDRGHSDGDRGQQGGQDEQGPPRGDVGGRGGRTRTTGSGGGIGAGAGSYRVKGRHG